MGRKKRETATHHVEKAIKHLGKATKLLVPNTWSFSACKAEEILEVLAVALNRAREHCFYAEFTEGTMEKPDDHKARK